MTCFQDPDDSTLGNTLLEGRSHEAGGGRMTISSLIPTSLL